jgi:hypothetical protein
LNLAGAVHEALLFEGDTHCSTGNGAGFVDAAAAVRLEGRAGKPREIGHELVNDRIVPFVEQVRMLEAGVTDLHCDNLLSSPLLDVLSFMSR